MFRWLPAFVLSASLSGAPFQCASDADPANAIEETPGEALYQLAEEFKKGGDDAAWRETLQYLIARYPASRFAEAAQRDLAEAPPSAAPSGAGSHTAASPK